MAKVSTRPSISSANIQNADFVHWISNYTGNLTSYKLTFSDLVSRIGTDLPFINDINGLITQGTNVTITGSGSTGDPYVINSTGGGGGSGTVTSVSLTVPTGLVVTGSPITTSGTFAVTLDTGYTIPTTALLADKVSLTGSYANPTWITSLAWSKITGAPSFITGVSWGSITGTLSTQTDLQIALDGKQPTGNYALNYDYANSGVVFAYGDEFSSVNYIGSSVVNNGGLQINNTRPMYNEISNSSITLDLTYAGKTIASPDGTLQEVYLPDPNNYGPDLYDGWTVEVKGISGQTDIFVYIENGGFSFEGVFSEVVVDQDSWCSFIWDAAYQFYRFYLTPSSQEINSTISNAVSNRVIRSGDTLGGRFKRTITNLTDAASIAIDLSQNNYFRVVLGGNRTLANPTNLPSSGERQVFIVEVVQDATGGRTLAFGTNYQVGDVDATISSAANSITYLVMIANNSSVDIVDAKGSYT